MDQFLKTLNTFYLTPVLSTDDAKLMLIRIRGIALPVDASSSSGRCYLDLIHSLQVLTVNFSYNTHREYFDKLRLLIFSLTSESIDKLEFDL